MTISTYAELKTGIANWLGRADLTNRDDEFIDNVEAKFNRRLRIRAMEAVATGSFVAGTPTIALPTDFLEVRSFTYDIATTIPRKLEFITLESAEALEYSGSAPPKWYTFANGAIRLYPTPDQAYAYTLRHFAKITDLNGTDTTNFILTNYPDAYLYGCLIEACAYISDDPRLPIWKQGFEEVMAEIVRADKRERFRSPVAQFDPAIARLGRSSGYDVLTDSY